LFTVIAEPDRQPHFFRRRFSGASTVIGPLELAITFT